MLIQKRPSPPRHTNRRAGAFSLGLAALGLCTLLAGCVPGASTYGHGLEKSLDRAETSAIPGATARVFPAPPGAPTSGATAGYCVTTAGFCPLAAATPAGLNCLCQAGTLAYGGTTGAAPAPIQQ